MDPAVFRAASSGDLNFLQSLSGSSSLQQVTIGKNTVLHVALQFKQFMPVVMILDLLPNLVYEVNSSGNTPLHIAARIGATSMVKLLLDRAKELDVETDGRKKLLSMVNLVGDTALHVAVRHGNSEFVKELIIKYDTGELAEQINNAGESALFLAVDRQDYVMASLIVDNARACSCAGRHGMNVLHALVIHTSTYSNKGYTLFQRLRDIEEYRKMYKKARSRTRRLLIITFVWVVNMLFLIRLPKLLGDPFEKPDITQDRDVLRLCTSGTIPEELVKSVMVKWGHAINQHDDSGWTPLHIAAHLGNAKFVKLLLEFGNSPAYERNRDGLSAFHIAAAKEGNYDVMKTLMEACPDIYELLDYRGRNALHTAAESGCWTALFVFGSRKEFVGLANEQDKEGNTPSHLAAINGDTSMAKRLGKGGEIVLNATNKEGFTTMDNVLLTRKLHSREVEQLWEMGARLSLRGALSKIGIKNSDPRRKTELAGDNSDPRKKTELAGLSSDPRKKTELAGLAGDNSDPRKKTELAGLNSDPRKKTELAGLAGDNSDPRKKTELAGDGDGDGDCNGKRSGDDNGDGNGDDEGMSNSDFLKQVREGNMLVATLIATVTFTAAFTVPGGFNQNGNVGEGLAVLSKITAFRVFLIANTLAFGLSATSVFVHFLALTTSEEIAFHKKIERRTAFYTNWSIGAMLVAFMAGTYTVVPHSLGISVAVLLSCCFLSSLFLPVTIKDYCKYI